MRKMLNGTLERRRMFLCTAIVGALALPASSAWAAKDALLTSVKGEASNSTGALDTHAEVADGDPLETGDESGCSVLVDQNAVVELCGRTRISFSTDSKRGNRIINVESGSVRLIVEPRQPGERIEIHTPAAIATILGTIVYVTVDPITGEETFTSSESRVNVRDRSAEDCTPVGLPAEAGVPRCEEGTTIGALEQLKLVPDGKQHETKPVTEQELAMLGGCLLDFHDLAAKIDRLSEAEKATQRVVAVDVATVDLPPVSLDEGPQVETENDNDIEAQIQPFDDPSQEEQIREMLEEMPVPDCGGIPGDHCNF